MRPVLIALWLTGCRPSEIKRVTVEDFDGKRWTIKKHKTRRKKKAPRVVYLSPCAVTLSRILAGDRTSGPLFQPGEGRRWKYSEMRQRFHRLREREKIDKRCVLYSLRHTWITNALLRGLDVATVAALAGTSIKMISDHYGHLSQHENHLEAAVNRVAGASQSP